MEASVFLLLLSALFHSASAQNNFYGQSVSFTRVQRTDGTFQVSFHQRENGRSNCQTQLSYKCDDGMCTGFDETAVTQTDQSSVGGWCQSEGHTTATIPSNRVNFSMSNSGCCWESNIDGKSSWTASTRLDLGTRSDTHAINRCPVTATVALLRVPENCFSRLRLLAYDPDGDHVRCSFYRNTTRQSNITLDEDACTLRRKGHIQTGVHVFELKLEDYSTKNITVTYTDGTSAAIEAFRTNNGNKPSPLCTVPLQFSLEILPPLPKCQAGQEKPLFLVKTPSHGRVEHATVGQKFTLYAQVEAHQASISDFQVSGPANMTKTFTDSENGKAEVSLSWTPQPSDAYRFVPVCFTAQTNKTQSEMRCVVIEVTRSSTLKGTVMVDCKPNRMTVVLEKASMPDINVSFLKLKDPSCSLTSNATHIMGTMSFTTCGTQIEEKGDFIVFENEIISFELPKEIITRRRMVKISFACQFPKSLVISTSYIFNKADYIFTESNFGSFGYSFEIFQDSNFTAKLQPAAYPVEVVLMQTVYMGIQAESDLPDVTLFVDSCKATPDDNPGNPRSYDLVKNGCVKDETLKVHPSNITAFMFEVQAFKFTGDFDQVYITCSVILCESGNPFSRCSQGCVNAPKRRRRRGLDRETARHFVTQGPFHVVREDVPTEDATDVRDVVHLDDDAADVQPTTKDSGQTKSSRRVWRFQEAISTNGSTIVFAVAFMIMVVAMAVTVHCLVRKRNANDRITLLDAEEYK